MGNIKVILPDDIEQKFRDEVYKRYGMKKGNITVAVLEAVEEWIEKKNQKRFDPAKQKTKG